MKNSGLIILVLLSQIFSSSTDVEILKELKKTPFFEKQMLFTGERFPNLVVTKNGVIVATWGKKNFVSRRSTDGGISWEPPVSIGQGINGGGMIINENNGELITFLEKGDHPPAPIMTYFSNDNGQSWQSREVKIHPDKNGNLPSMHMNEHGITISSGKYKGRILRATRYYGKGNQREYWPNHYTNAIYSDDGGKVWHTSNPFPAYGTGEAAVVELSDGSLYYNSRRHLSTDGLNPRMRHIAKSMDGGQNWKDLSISKELPDGEKDRDYGLMAGLDRLPFEGHDILIFSNIESQTGRKNGTVWLSFDGGKSWPIKRLVESKGFKYSSLAVGRKNTPSEGYIYLLYETGTKDNINDYGGGVIARFNLSWLMEGKDVNQFLK